MKKNIFAYLILATSVLLFTACGGGGSSGGSSPPPPEPQGSSDWDEMVWDTDDWG